MRLTEEAKLYLIRRAEGKYKINTGGAFKIQKLQHCEEYGVFSLGLSGKLDHCIYEGSKENCSEMEIEIKRFYLEVLNIFKTNELESYRKLGISI